MAAADSASSPPPGREWLATLGEGRRPLWTIVAVAVGLHVRSLSYDYTHLDDVDLLVDARYFLADLGNVVTAFRQSAFYMLHGLEAYYRPLLTVSFILDTHLLGTSLTGYHAMNLGLHAAACLLVFRLFRKLGHGPSPSLLGALLVAVHPALTQAVAWVPGRNDSLMAVCVVASFTAFVEYRETANRRALLFHLAMLLGALFTKESAVVLPLLCLGWVVLVRRAAAGRLGIAAAGWLAALTIWYELLKAALQTGDGRPLFDLGRSAANLPGLVQLLGKALLPFNLSVMPVVKDTTLVYGVLALAAIGIAVARAPAARRGRIAFGGLWFLLFLAPTLMTSKALMLEHRLYVPLVGLLLLLLEVEPLGAFRIERPNHRLLGGALVGLFAVLTLAHSGDYKNEAAFYANAVASSPHSGSAHLGQAIYLHRNGRLDEAEPEYRLVLELDPQAAIAHNNLGVLLMNRGRLEEAEREIRRELEANPRYDRAYYNLGLVYLQQQRLDEAEAMWKRTIEINPHNTEVYPRLINLCAERGDVAGSQRYLREFQQYGKVQVVAGPAAAPAGPAGP